MTTKCKACKRSIISAQLDHLTFQDLDKTCKTDARRRRGSFSNIVVCLAFLEKKVSTFASISVGMMQMFSPKRPPFSSSSSTSSSHSSSSFLKSTIECILL